MVRWWKNLTISTGGGERERIFWKNYFFHCAYTRYEAGLSIDEIWSDQPPTVRVSVPEEPEEETITFEEEGPVEAAFATPEPQVGTEVKPDEDGSNPSEGNSYDMVNENEEEIDYELDELEAEIARELED